MQPLIKYDAPWIDPRTGRPTREFYRYVSALDLAFRRLSDDAAAMAQQIEDLQQRVTDLENP